MQTTTSLDRPTTLCEDWARFSRAMDNVPDIVVIVGADRRIRYVNPAAVEVSAYPSSYLLGRLPEEAWGNRIAEAYRQPIDTCFRTGEVTKSEAEIHLASKDFYVQISCVPLAGREGSVREVMCVTQDVTERRAAEEERARLWAELEEAQRLESLGGLARAVAHDFNNMLAVVLGYANLLQDALPAGSPLRGLVTCIEDTGREAAELTRQLMLYSGHATRMVQPIDLSKLVGGLDRLLDTIVSKRAQLDLALASDLPEIAADDVQVRQVVVNLVSNAADSMQDAAGTVTVSTGVQVIAPGEAIPGHVRGDCSPGTYVYLEVVDEGSGIAERSVSRIFEPFFTTKSTGHGLGLPATLGIVRGHGGVIVLETECGKGTKVRALFPTA